MNIHLSRSSSMSPLLWWSSTSRLMTVSILLLMLWYEYTNDCLFVTAARKKRRNGNPQARAIRVLNQCGVKVDIYWIHPDTGELADSSTNGDGIMFGGETGIDSYIGHAFEVKEVMNNKTKSCRTRNHCLKNTFAVNTNEDQIFTLNKNLESITVEDNKSRAMNTAKEAIDQCSQISDTIAALKSTTGTSSGITDSAANKEEILKQIDALAECLQKNLQNKLDETKYEIQFQASVRKEMGIKLKQYICDGGVIGKQINSDVFFGGGNNDDDEQVEQSKTMTTKSIRNATWTYYPQKDVQQSKQSYESISHPLRVLFESDYSSITQVKNFLSKDQCRQIIDATKQKRSDNNIDIQTEQHLHIQKVTQQMIASNFALQGLTDKIESLLESVYPNSNRLLLKYYTSESTVTDHDDDNGSFQVLKVRTMSHVPSTARQTSTDSESQQRKQDCEVQSDGSCVSTVTATQSAFATVDTDATTTTSSASNTNFRVTKVDNTTAVNLIIFCKAPTIPSTTTKANDNSQSNITAAPSQQQQKISGMIFFPKTGVKIVPYENIGDAVMVVHEDESGRRDADPYVDEYITCPITLPPTTTTDNDDSVVVTIEDSIII